MKARFYCTPGDTNDTSSADNADTNDSTAVSTADDTADTSSTNDVTDTTDTRTTDTTTDTTDTGSIDNNTSTTDTDDTTGTGGTDTTDTGNTTDNNDTTEADTGGADDADIVVSGADPKQGDAPLDAAHLNSYAPKAADTIIVNSQEFPAEITPFTNWKGNAALHNTAAKPGRSSSDIRFITLHETSGSATGTGFSPPFTAHFVVGGDEIRQFNDLSEKEWHVGIFNDGAVGIEFKNPDWVTTKAAGQDYIDAHWSGDYPFYTVPSSAALENLVLLVQRLVSRTDNNFPAIDPVWLQLVSYNDVSGVWTFADADIPADDKKSLKKFFVYSSGINYLTPATFPAPATGIFSHNSVSDLMTVSGKTVVDEDLHTDGSFQALYTWLRIMQSNDAATALQNAKDLVSKKPVTAHTIQAYEGYNKPKGTTTFVPYSGSSKRPVFLIDIETML